MSYSTTTYPYDAVCYITTNLNNQGSGAIIGPHTILTCSHLLWDATNSSQATSVSIFPGYSQGGTQLTGKWIEHFNKVDDANDALTKAASQQDFAIIDVAQDLTSYGSFGVATGYSGGTVHLTGYPDTTNGAQNDVVGTVSADPSYSVLDYGSVTAFPGNSGGPLWIDQGATGTPQPGQGATNPDIVGIVSTTGWAVQLTAADWSAIQAWEQSDASLWTPPVAPTVSVKNISVARNAAVAAASMIAAVNNPSGDSITAYQFIDNGGDGGRFVVNGVTQPDGQAIIVQASALSSIQYVGGPAAGSETLGVAVFDATTNSYSAVSTLTATTTPGAAFRDFNADGETDVLWRNDSGDTALWLSNPGPVSFSFQDLGTIPTAWQIAGSGDFNGDGKADVLWRDTSSGDVGLWASAAGSAVGFGFQDLGTIPTSWQIAATDDFNGDGKSDVLWRNSNGDVALWGSVAGSSVAFGFQDFGVIPTAWQIAGTGDFGGGSKAGVLWRNTDGDVALWQAVAGSSVSFAFQDLGIIPTAWQIAGTGDFNNDGKSDVLWRNSSSGDVALWLSNPGSATSFTFDDLGTIPTSWQIAGTGDFNGDGKSDVLWRNGGSGDVALWLSNPGSAVGFAFQDFGTIPSSWHITPS